MSYELSTSISKQLGPKQPTLEEPLSEQIDFERRDSSSDLQLTYLMCSRFCHDLAAPLGAISIGLDMLEESGAGEASLEDSPQKILKYSVQSAMYKLELIRCLCGYGAYSDRPTLGEISQVIDKCFDPDKYTITWPSLQEDFYEQIVGNAARLYLALFMIGVESMPRGGTLSLNNDFSLTLSSSLIKFNEDTLQSLTGERTTADIDSRAVIGYFAHVLASRLGVKIHVNFDKPNVVRICFE